jgi:hypothetical protein
MKRFAVVFIILGVLARGAWSQEEGAPGGIHFSGGVETGVRIVKDDNNDAPLIFLYSDTSSDYFDISGEEPYLGNPTGVRTYLDIDYDGGNWGFTSEIQGDNVSNSNNSKYPAGFSLPFAYLWAEFFDGRVLVSAGQFQTILDNAPTITALRLGLHPMEALSLFVDIPFANTTGGTIDGYELPHVFKEAIIGFEYADSSFGNIALYAKFYDSETGMFFDYPSVPGPPVTLDPAAESVYADLKFSLDCFAVPRLMISLTADVKSLGLDYGTEGVFGETFAYFISEGFSAGLLFQQNVYFNERAYYTFEQSYINGLPSNAGRSYILNIHQDPSTLYVFGVFGTYQVLPRLSAGLQLTDAYWKDNLKYNIGIKPNVSFYVAESALIRAYYKLDLARTWADQSGISHGFQLDFTWAF